MSEVLQALAEDFGAMLDNSGFLYQLCYRVAGYVTVRDGVAGCVYWPVVRAGEARQREKRVDVDVFFLDGAEVQMAEVQMVAERMTAAYSVRSGMADGEHELRRYWVELVSKRRLLTAGSICGNVVRTWDLSFLQDGSVRREVRDELVGPDVELAHAV